MAEPKNSKKINQLLSDLQTENVEKFDATLDALQIYGNKQVIKPLFEIILSSNNENNKEKIIEFLSNLKDTPSKEEIISIIQDTKYKPILSKVLSTIWNSPLDYSNYLELFVKIAVENDYLVVLDCLTILENMEGPFSEQSILESQLRLKEYLEDNYTKSKEKDLLISDIATLIKSFDRDNQEFD